MSRPRNKPSTPSRPQNSAAGATPSDVPAWHLGLAALLLVLATWATYRGTMYFPYHFDDTCSIVDNPTIRQLWPPWAPLQPPPEGGLTVAGRPLLNYSFALSYAISGIETWGYHVLNLLIHVGAGLVLFGVARRTLLRLPPPALGWRDGPVWSGSTALWGAAALAGLWMLHPLQTESVTYIVQRAESLVGLFFLLTFHTFIRAMDTGGGRATAWLGASVACCLAGMAAKEVMASAPLLVLLYDRAFVAGSFAAAWRARRGYYLGLASTWVLLAVLVVGAQGRGGTVGFATPITPWDYFTTQAWAIVRYLRLTVWPSSQVLDYGYLVITHPAVWIPCGLLVLALVAATVIALVRRPRLGFLGAWFFAILAPTSSLIPVATQPVAEHRMYLPLAALAALVVVGLVTWAGRRGLMLVAAASVALGFATERRNADYRTVETIWRDTIAKRPDNARAHRNLGLALYHGGDHPAALVSLQEALRLDPRSPEVHNYTANVMLALHRVSEAAQHAAEAVRLAPNYGDAHNNYGVALARARRPAEAAQHFEKAVALMPGSASPRLNLANVRIESGRGVEALLLLDEAVRLDPGMVEVHLARGNALMLLRRADEAVAAYGRAVQLRPTLGQAHFALGNALVDAGRLSDAITHLREAVRLAPRSVPALNNLGDALVRAGRTEEAAAVFAQALALDPGNPYLRENLARQKAGR